MESHPSTEDGEVVFLGAIARTIFEIDAPPPRLTAAAFLNRIRQNVLFQKSSGQCSSNAENQALESYEELMRIVLGMRNHFDPKQSLQDPPSET